MTLLPEDLGDGTVRITLVWSTRNGECEDCGLPAAVLVDGKQKVCTICGAYYAINGSSLAWIDPEMAR